MKSLVTWFAKNTVAANLLMLILVVGGLITLPTIKKEIFPSFGMDIIIVSVIYPGAAPEEVEKSICLPIEEAIEDL
ncbi:MAG: efflux RND transporter permease subunit, partial [Planctomycetes bacterium]|nr:efflux RND transporter permease subunit [Planctomycetota bacterium]